MNKDHKMKTRLGLNESVVKEISAQKNEPEWMLEIRLKALNHFLKTSIQNWGPDLSELDMQDIHYYIKPVEKSQSSWEHVPQDIKKTFDYLGLPAAEQRYLAGLGAQYESEVVYHNLKKEWADQGVLFLDTDSALKAYPEIFKQYFGSIVPFNDNKFAALNTACWSGGSFIYVPPKVQVTIPLQAYFRIQAERMGQFERTLIIADEGSLVTYVEGCTAPAYSASSLHSAVVEIVAKAGSRVRYYTIQNWSKNVYNLVTKRAVAYKDSVVEWIDGNLGSKITMKYPAVILKEEGAKAEILSIAMASSFGQVQDTGAKVIHMAPNTTSRITSKSVSRSGGRSSYRGLVKILRGAKNCKSFVQCDALMLDQISRSDAYPSIQVKESSANVGHEASVSRIDDELVFYLTSRGIDANAAKTLIVNGFVEPFVKELPMEFAIEMNRLIQLEVEGSVG
ncbi:MAG: FeS assembly protein SufB [candidate division TM6 bacterium GW2011_GWF2_37_49]|nr:MAG: FeS assembly protein SufB [candidate division TM6 bacterium GW2011_GWF2_37_49]